MTTSAAKLITMLALAGTLTACALPDPRGAAATPAPTPVAAQSAQIVADAVVVPVRAVELHFALGGTVAEMLVAEGDMVAAGAPLARLGTRDLELEVAQQRANLAQAEALYEQLVAGPTDAQVRAQAAQLRSAQAQFERAGSGNVSASDIAGAQAQLRAALARLDALTNPSAAAVSAARLGVNEAESALEQTRSSASAGKTNAGLAMQQAADSLTRAQASYATARENWDFVRETGQDPTNPETRLANGDEVQNRLNDVQQRQYYETFVQAEAALRSAEKAVEQAQVSYDAARQAEALQVQQSEAALANARQQLDALTNPGANDIAQAQASVDQARATLQKLQAGGTAADVAVAQAALDQSAAQLEQLTAPARPVELAEAEARVAGARAALQQAEYRLAQATLVAPFAGMVAERTLEIGQRVGTAEPSAAAPIVLADSASWLIETDTLSERDVVRVRVGAPAQISFDALPGVALAGTVGAIEPRGVDRYGDITYTVRVTPETWDERLRWNMSATVAIEPTDP